MKKNFLISDEAQDLIDEDSLWTDNSVEQESLDVEDNPNLKDTKLIKIKYKSFIRQQENEFEVYLIKLKKNIKSYNNGYTQVNDLIQYTNINFWVSQEIYFDLLDEMNKNTESFDIVLTIETPLKTLEHNIKGYVNDLEGTKFTNSLVKCSLTILEVIGM